MKTARKTYIHLLNRHARQAIIHEGERLMGGAVGARVSLGRSVGRCDRTLLRTVLVMIVMVSPLWVMPLSTPVMADVVVVMHRDSAVNTAVRTITENAPDVRVVEYGSLEYALTISRTVGRVVWVSHGSEEGILAEERLSVGECSAPDQR